MYIFAGFCYAGHNRPLTDLCFSNDSSLVLSSSADGTACVWRAGRVESPVVLFSHVRHQAQIGGRGAVPVSSSTSSSSSGRNRPFGCEITSAQFFYQDRFVFLVIPLCLSLR